MIDRYTTPAMREVWADTTRFGRWLEVELLATEVAPVVRRELAGLTVERSGAM